MAAHGHDHSRPLSTLSGNVGRSRGRHSGVPSVPTLILENNSPDLGSLLSTKCGFQKTSTFHCFDHKGTVAVQGPPRRCLPCSVQEAGSGSGPCAGPHEMFFPAHFTGRTGHNGRGSTRVGPGETVGVLVTDCAELVSPRVYLASVLGAEISLLSGLCGGESTPPPAWPSSPPTWALACSSPPTCPQERTKCSR